MLECVDAEQTYGTTTRNKDEAWTFTLESLYYTQVNGTPTEYPGPIKDQYILVQNKDTGTGKKEVLTVVPPSDRRDGILGTVRVP